MSEEFRFQCFAFTFVFTRCFRVYYDGAFSFDLHRSSEKTPVENIKTAAVRRHRWAAPSPLAGPDRRWAVYNRTTVSDFLRSSASLRRQNPRHCGKRALLAMAVAGRAPIVRFIITTTRPRMPTVACRGSREGRRKPLETLSPSVDVSRRRLTTD